MTYSFIDFSIHRVLIPNVMHKSDRFISFVLDTTQYLNQYENPAKMINSVDGISAVTDHGYIFGIVSGVYNKINRRDYFLKPQYNIANMEISKFLQMSIARCTKS